MYAQLQQSFMYEYVYNNNVMYTARKNAAEI